MHKSRRYLVIKTKENLQMITLNRWKSEQWAGEMDESLQSSQHPFTPLLRLLSRLHFASHNWFRPASVPRCVSWQLENGANGLNVSPFSCRPARNSAAARFLPCRHSVIPASPVPRTRQPADSPGDAAPRRTEDRRVGQVRRAEQLDARPTKSPVTHSRAPGRGKLKSRVAEAYPKLFLPAFTRTWKCVPRRCLTSPPCSALLEWRGGGTVCRYLNGSRRSICGSREPTPSLWNLNNGPLGASGWHHGPNSVLLNSLNRLLGLFHGIISSTPQASVCINPTSQKTLTVSY